MSSSSFYPTYEEWKPNHRTDSTKRTYSFYPTYEEWKPRFPEHRKLVGETSFYPTYEEWKPKNSVNSSGRCIILFILPMRNGNKCHPPTVQCFSLPFYPTYEEWKHEEFSNLATVVDCFLSYL